MMKTAATYKPTAARREAIPYPNGVTRRQMAHKLADFLLLTATGVGIAAILLFLLALA